MFITIKNKLISLLQLILVFIYIVFEELIWEGIAYPIYQYVHSLKILQKVEEKLHGVNAYIILVIFVFMLASVESLGIYAGILFVSGQVLLGLSIYVTKIPIAAFTFWMFRVTEDKLMQFGWFKWLYESAMKIIVWIKSSDTYISMMIYLKRIKEQMKLFKIKYFSKESRFTAKIKNLYRSIKESLGKK